ncbi:MAG TPA: GNAT family N-acetyltransferase [Rhizomicrobium sp.]|nr:GNAT family N-acetyltransferase [Rhizomicrobium sp.]
MIETPRLLLRSWQPGDGDAFAAMNAHPEVMADLGGPLDRATSDAKLARFTKSFADRGLTRWLIEDRATGRYLGYCGLAWHDTHALGPHHDIGWRLTRDAWGKGYAFEAATAALADAFTRAGINEVFAYTAPDNLRSQAVMARLGLERLSDRDFIWPEGEGAWHGLVWVARTNLPAM